MNKLWRYPGREWIAFTLLEGESMSHALYQILNTFVKTAPVRES